MPWPGLNDLQEALQHPKRAFTDRELRDGKIALNQLGLPLSWSGNFAAVFQVITNGHPYAIRCFTHNPLGKQNHYAAIDSHLKTNGRPATFIDFDYQEDGLVCRGQKYPLIKMPWIHGQTLDEFTYENISRADVLEQLVSKWYQAATELQQLPIAHNDLQHGNIMVEKGSRGDIKLVDYDSLYVPQFARMQSPETGHRHYQHPQRDQRHYGPQVDNFPALVIYASLTALAHDSGARARRATPESLLFAQHDLQDPTNSKLFQYLKQSPHRPTSQLANILSEAALAPVYDTPTLEQARAQPTKSNLPSWLNQATLPSTPAWTEAETPANPSTEHLLSPRNTAPTAPRNRAQHNRNLIGQKMQQISYRLKPAVISYAQETQLSGWTFQPVAGITGNRIRTIQELDVADPDATALTTVLLAIANHRGEAPLSSIGISTSQIRKIRDISDDHTQSRVDFSNQNYVNDALNDLTRFDNSLGKLPANFKPEPWDTPQQIIRTIAKRYHVSIIAAIYGFMAVYSLPRFKTISHRAETFLAVFTVAFIIGALILAYFLLTTPPPSETTEPLRATPRPPIQSPGSSDVVLPTVTLTTLTTNPLGGIHALSQHYEECNGKYEHILNHTARKQDFDNKIKSGITLQQLQQFVADECPLPATFNPNVPSGPQTTIPPTPLARIQEPNAHTAPPPIPTLPPNPYQLSSAFKPSEIQSLSRQGNLVSEQDYEAIGCYHDPNPSRYIRHWVLFTTPDQDVENSFAVHYIEPVQLQHGTCYTLTIQHWGKTKWRACRTEPYGTNCNADSSEFLWERYIPAFRGTAETTTHLWRPPGK